MATIFDYIDFYKDTPLSKVKWNTMDNLLCACLAYLPFFSFEGEKSLLELYETAVDIHDNSGSFMAPKSMDMLKRLQASKRYHDLRITRFVQEKTPDLQFLAVTFYIDDITVVAYEGTDNSFAGWFENFRLIYQYPTATHKLAADYLRELPDNLLKGDVYVVGHSKGGNLALSAIMEAPDFIYQRIKEVYNFDGPGLRKAEFEGAKFTRILPKLINVVPTDSAVGVLMYNKDYDVVRSSRRSFLQHDPTSWEVFGEYFLPGKLSASSQQIHHSTTEDLEKIDKKMLEENLEAVFAKIRGQHSKEFRLTPSDIKMLYDSLRDIDPAVKKYVEQIFSSAFLANYTRAGRSQTQNDVKALLDSGE